ncbi:MAG: hypothetical protein R2910_06415 [Gemmatimonadales bacterium]
MRLLQVALLLAIPALPGQLKAQAAQTVSDRIALPEVKRAGKWACGAQASEDPDIAAFADRVRQQLLSVQASLRSGQNEYLSESWRYFTNGGFFNPDAYWAATQVPVAREALSSGWPIPAPPPDSLRVSGFVANAEDTWNGPTFYGPDPEYFLSGSFFGQACFRTVNADLSPVLEWKYPAVPEGWVGLEFRPGPSSVRNAIRGVLWFDPHTADLGVLEWRYVNLPSWASGLTGGGRWAARSWGGGRIDLASLADGGRFVREWIVRTPVPVVDPSRYSSSIGRYLVRAGHVTEVRDSSGKAVERFRYRYVDSGS